MSRPRAAAAALAAGAFTLLAALVAHGDLTSVDQWAIDHAMPGADFTGSSTLAAALIPVWDVHWHGALHIVAELVTVPASFTPATVIAAAACLRLRGRAGVTLAAAYAAGNVIEVLVKATLTRPPLYSHGVHLASFDSSYPSGHTIRTVLVAFAIAWAWPRLARWAIAWAVCSVVLIELAGQHVPSDIVGGLLVATALVVTAWASRPSTACRPSARVR